MGTYHPWPRFTTPSGPAIRCEFVCSPPQELGRHLCRTTLPEKTLILNENLYEKTLPKNLQPCSVSKKFSPALPQKVVTRGVRQRLNKPSLHHREFAGIATPTRRLNSQWIVGPRASSRAIVGIFLGLWGWAAVENNETFQRWGCVCARHVLWLLFVWRSHAP